MNLDLTQDWTVWDNLEPVTYASRRAEGDAIDSVVSAKRRAPTTHELATSGGVYTGADLTWLIPRVLLDPVLSTAGERGQAKPGDSVTDIDGVAYVVRPEGVSLVAFKSVWRLETRNLILSYDLRDTISIERPEISHDAVGGVLRVWPGSTPYADIPARVQLLTQEEAEARGLRGFSQVYAVIVGQQVTLTPEDRLRWGTKLLQIKGLHNPQRIDELPVIDAVGGLYGVGD